MFKNDTINDCSGYCSRCRKEHTLPRGNARRKAAELIGMLERNRSVALCPSDIQDSETLSTDALYGEARGKMFGVLECLNAAGSTVWLYAFSGQYNGLWQVPGWVPPLFDIEKFDRINVPGEQAIKELGRRMKNLAADTEEFQDLRRERRERARALMRAIHALYRIHNFRGISETLDGAFQGRGNKPTGTGDCCAPKLLNQAASENLVPLSLAEFYFGKENRSKTRQHGHFYPPCDDKCKPLLGFMLCGAEEQRAAHGS